MKRIVSYLIALGLIGLTGLTVGVFAQEPLNPAARESIQLGEARIAEAQAAGIPAFPDRPLWRDAIALGREAVRQAPGRSEPLRFLAKAYTLTRWYFPAWRTWLEYLQVGGSLDREAQEWFVLVGNELGFTSYHRGDFEQALAYYLQVIDRVPGHLEAYIWAGRILIETGRPAQAIPYWQEVVTRDPVDRRAAYFLELARDQARWGISAVNAFREGVSAHEVGNLSLARERFARATTANPDYAAAWAWLGRVAFEQGHYRDAATFYDRARRLEPTNEAYQFFYRESRRLAGD